MTRLPQRHSLVHQLSNILGDDIRSSRWNEWLPEERELARLYQVSRCTLRSALGKLRQEGMVETKHGMGTRVVKPGRAGRRRQSEASIGLLIPRALDHIRHFVTMVINDLRERLFDHGYQISVHDHPEVAAGRLFEFLEKLVGQHHHACWLLVGCGPETQRWFSELRIPAVVSGTCDPSLGLPFVSIDNYALGRHAAMTLLQHGHSRVGALLTHSNPGLRSGLADVFVARGPAASSFTALEVDNGAERVARAVDRLMALSPRPTALFLAESNLYLTAISRLSQLRLRVPEDISLLCRDDEPYLSSLLPAPARYSKNPHSYAKRLVTFMLKTIGSEPLPSSGGYIMAEFVPGPSLAKFSPLPQRSELQTS